MPYLTLDIVDLIFASALIFMVVALSASLKLQFSRQMLWAGIRTVIQLSILGSILSYIFKIQDPLIVVGYIVVMTLIAGYSAAKRPQHQFKGIRAIGIASIWSAAWMVVAFCLIAVVRPDPWYAPQYLIPFVGLILGNMLNGVSLGLNSFLQEVHDKKNLIETLIALGATRHEACRYSMRQAMRTGLIPIMNSMSVAGLVSIPGMMTGQLLAGADPSDAARYQIVVMFMVAASTAFGTLFAVLMAFYKITNSRSQLIWPAS